MPDAKIEVKHKCGHTEEHQVSYKSQDYEWDRLSKRDCNFCRDRRKQEMSKRLEDPALLEAAKEKAAEIGLAALTGSQKQIVWASEIRLRQLETVLPVSRPILGALTSASWWIDHRRASSSALDAEARKIAGPQTTRNVA